MSADCLAVQGHATSSVRKNKGERERDEERRILAALARGVDITEVFSPNRVTQVCKKYGLTPGEAMDLSTGWDFDRGEDRRQAIKHIKQEKPMVVIGSPPCTVFSQLQTMSMHTQSAAWMEEYEVRKQHATRHMEFCMGLYKLQMAWGRYFLHGHPECASSWRLPRMEDLLKQEGVWTVNADLCMYGMTATCKGVTKPAKKLTTSATNAWCVAEALGRRCDKIHQHIALFVGRAAQAAVYPRQLCKAISKAVAKQNTFDRRGLVCLSHGSKGGD